MREPIEDEPFDADASRAESRPVIDVDTLSILAPVPAHASTYPLNTVDDVQVVGEKLIVRGLCHPTFPLNSATAQ
jgi:hypothetical protein